MNEYYKGLYKDFVGKVIAFHPPQETIFELTIKTQE
jgi:hypothetical protein